MRQIKFRGVRMSDGKTIYGYYHVQKGAAYIDEWRIQPETVAQLVDYDVNGEEVYDGDVLVDLNGVEYDACFVGLPHTLTLKK